jgi:hypothetical protein
MPTTLLECYLSLRLFHVHNDVSRGLWNEGTETLHTSLERKGYINGPAASEAACCGMKVQWDDIDNLHKRLWQVSQCLFVGPLIPSTSQTLSMSECVIEKKLFNFFWGEVCRRKDIYRKTVKYDHWIIQVWGEKCQKSKWENSLAIDGKRLLLRSGYVSGEFTKMSGVEPYSRLIGTE